jgi:DNA-binding transcriptional LysR family regulator
MICCESISDTYDVELQLLRTFVTVARLGSFSAAAAELGYTQAAVSQQIAALEGDLKTRLLSRRPVTPTEAGARLLEHAGPILLRLDAARADVTRLTGAPSAALTIGVTPLAGAICTPAAALAALRARMPRLAVTVQTVGRPEAAAAVARGDLDLALTDGLTAPGDPLPELAPVTAVGLAEEPALVVLPAGHPLAGRRGLRLPDLADARWIAADDIAPSLAEIGRHAGPAGFRAALSYTGQDTSALLRLAAGGHGLTLLPRAALPPGETALLPGVTAVPVLTPRLGHRVELVHAALPPGSAAAALAALLARGLAVLAQAGRPRLGAGVLPATGRPGPCRWRRGRCPARAPRPPCAPTRGW